MGICISWDSVELQRFWSEPIGLHAWTALKVVALKSCFLLVCLWKTEKYEVKEGNKNLRTVGISPGTKNFKNDISQRNPRVLHALWWVTLSLSVSYLAMFSSKWTKSKGKLSSQNQTLQLKGMLAHQSGPWRRNCSLAARWLLRSLWWSHAGLLGSVALSPLQGGSSFLYCWIFWKRHLWCWFIALLDPEQITEWDDSEKWFPFLFKS